MSYCDNSALFSKEITLLASYLKKAVVNRNSTIGKEESEIIVRDQIVKVFSQIVQDCSGEGHWKDEKDHVLLKTHCWMFLNWMNTLLESGDDGSQELVEMSTAFYVEVVRLVEAEKLLVQCLSQVKLDVTRILMQDVLLYIGDYPSEEHQCFLLRIIHHCLKNLCKVTANSPPAANSLKTVLSLVTRHMKSHASQLEIMGKLADKLKELHDFLQGGSKDIESTNQSVAARLLTENQNMVAFENNMNQLLIEELGVEDDVCQSTMQTRARCRRTEYSTELLLYLVCFIHDLITQEWKETFSWQSDVSAGCTSIQTSEKSIGHSILFDIFCICVSLQRDLKYKEDDCMVKQQGLVNILDQYFQWHGTALEKDVITAIQEIEKPKEKVCHGDKPLNEAFEEAIFRIEENLVDNEKSFEWLLLTEELYQDERWVKCLVDNGNKYVCLSTIKLLLDVLCVLHENALQDSSQEHIYHSVKKVILDMVPSLSLLEQEDIIEYNLSLIVSTVGTDQSLFILPHHYDVTIDSTTEMLTMVMNKMVNKGGETFSHEVFTGITKGALIAPYLTMKILLYEAIKNSGYQSIVCELLQTMSKFTRLRFSVDDAVLVRVLADLVTTLSSRKLEGQFLKLISVLLQPVLHPVFESEEPYVLDASDVLNILVEPLFTSNEEDVATTFLLNILLTILACGQTSSPQQHWILGRNPVEMMVSLLGMVEDCLHFWDDWVNDDITDGTMPREDIALDQAWTEMNLLTEILLKHLIPALAEAIVEEPSKYKNQSVWLENQLSSLDWTASLLVLPLLRENMMSFIIKLPKCLSHLFTATHLHALLLDDDDTGRTQVFWTMYFKSCALSAEVCAMFLSQLQHGHPRQGQAGDNTVDCIEIIESLSKVLPFSTWLQWKRLLNITREMLKRNYLIDIDRSWTSDLTMLLPEIHKTDATSECLVAVSSLLVAVLSYISTKIWTTSHVWSITLKNYISEVKQLSEEVGKQDLHLVRCHLLAHLCHVTFNIIPENFQENLIIVILDVLNTSLTNIYHDQPRQDFDHIAFLEEIAASVPQAELRLTITNKIKSIIVKNIAK